MNSFNYLKNIVDKLMLQSHMSHDKGEYWAILGNIGQYWEILGNIGKYWGTKRDK